MKTYDGDELTVLEVVMTLSFRTFLILTCPIWMIAVIIVKLLTDLSLDMIGGLRNTFKIDIPEFIELPSRKKARQVAKRLKNG